MGRVPHQVISKRRTITIPELADFFALSYVQIRYRLGIYNAERNGKGIPRVDFHNVYAVLDFVLWLKENITYQKTKIRKKGGVIHE